MKKLLATFSAVAAFGLTATRATETLTIATTPVPHAGILNVVKSLLVKEGVELKVRRFTDCVQSNMQVSKRRLDANFFQHQPYLGEFNKAKGTDLAAMTGVHIKPLGACSSKYEKLDELPSGATVVVPNNATSGGRALLLLDKTGVIKLKGSKNTTATPKNIVDNPKNIKTHELEATTLPRMLTQVDMALINTSYTLEAKLSPAKDALVIEGNDSPYVNILVARPGSKDSDVMQKPARALHSAEVRQFIQEKYEGAAVPVFWATLHNRSWKKPGF